LADLTNVRDVLEKEGIGWMPELILGLLEVLTINDYGYTIAKPVELGNSD